MSNPNNRPDQRGQRREGERRDVDTDALQPWNTGRVEREHAAHGDVGQQDAERASAQREQEMLDEQQADDSHPARAHRRADRDLFASPGRAAQEQVRNVQAWMRSTVRRPDSISGLGNTRPAAGQEFNQRCPG